jgi:N-acyl homoserine lactone hydrolase
MTAHGALQLPGGVPGATVSIRPILCGEYLSPPGWFFRDRASSARRALGVGVPKEAQIPTPLGAFLVEHPGAGPFLIDTGLHREATKRLRANFGRLQAYFFRTLKTSPERATVEQLTLWDTLPDEIRLLVMTHLHADHASAIGEFPEARSVVSQAEWTAAHAGGRLMNGYVARQLPSTEQVMLLDFESHGTDEHAGFDKTVDLFGDGSVRLLYTPGHTPGHFSVLLRVASGEVLIAGDAVYTLTNLKESVLPWKTIDDDLYRQSLGQLQGFAAAHPDTPIIPTHDHDVWAELPESY